jgi:ABC-type Zn2+ transport system substrate-binding protein/surface adhesin
MMPRKTWISCCLILASLTLLVNGSGATGAVADAAVEHTNHHHHDHDHDHDHRDVYASLPTHINLNPI